MNKEKEEALRALRTSKGQIEGIIKMIEEGRYCIDISNQIAATSALLRKGNKLIIKQHLNGCVKAAFLTKFFFYSSSYPSSTLLCLS